MAGFYDPPSFFLRPYYNLPCPVGATGGFCGHLASSNSRVVQHPMLHAKVVDALTANSAALVLRRTGWVSTVRRIVIQVIVLHLSQSHLSTFRTAGAFFIMRRSVIVHLKAGCGPGGRGDIWSCLGGQLVLGPPVRGDNFRGGQLVL